MKSFPPTSRLTQERETQVPTSYIQDAPSKFFLSLRVTQVKEAKVFFSDELHTRTRTWKPLSSARAGLSPKNKGDEKKKTPEGEKMAPRRKGSVCPQPRNFFFGSRVFGL